MTDEETREQAKEWARTALHFDEATSSRIAAWIEQQPLTLVGQPYCEACESVLCGACGDCHSWDLCVSDPLCPHDHDTTGGDCVAWWQAHKAIYTVQRIEDQG